MKYLINMKNQYSCIIYIIVFFFMSSTSSFGFYSIFDSGLLNYEAQFDGTIIMESQFLSYTNQNSRFVFEYYIANKNQKDQNNQAVIDIKISSLRTHNLLSIFSDMWDLLINSVLKDVSYMVMLPTDQILVFDKQGKRHTLDKFIPLFFPIVNLKKRVHEQSENSLSVFGISGEQHLLSVDSKGWDFFKYSPQKKVPFPLIDTNENFARLIYKCYSLHEKKALPSIFWFHKFDSTTVNSVQIPVSQAIFGGIHILDSEQKIMDKAFLLSSVSVVLPYSQFGFVIPIILKLEGQWTLSLKKNLK